MPQITNWTIPNSGGSTFRATLNSTLAAVQSNNSGGTSPSAIVAGMLWFDSATATLKRRNNANNAWLDVSSDTIAANTLRGNPSGSAQVEQEVTMTNLRSMLGFAQSTGDNGYVQFPGGAIVQWGTAAGTTTSGGGLTVTYPISFPAFTRRPIICNGDDALNHIVSVRAAGLTVNGFTANSNLISSAIRINYIVWGT